MASSDVVVRLRMVGQAAFQAASASAAGSLERLGSAGRDAGTGTSGLQKGLSKAAGPLNAIGAAASRGALALGAAGIAAAGVGIKFNASMEQSKVAFTNLLGSSSEAEGMLDRLYKVAANTPFEFPQLVQSTQRLLGFGMAASKVEPTMKAVGDAVAAAGGGSEQIDKVSTALGQMQAKGKVSTEELMQMAESGVPAMKLLADQLGITGSQLSSELQAGAISADKGIAALVTGMGKRYGGMAAAQSKTFNGMLSTLKDNAAQTLGAMTGPLFDALSTKVLPKVNEVGAAIQKWAAGGGVTVAINALKAGFAGKGASQTAGYAGALQKVVAVGRVFGTVWRGVSGYVGQFWAALKPAQPFLQNILLPLFKGFVVGGVGPLLSSFKLLIPVVRIIATALGWIGEKAAPLRGFFFGVGVVLGTVFGPKLLIAFTAVQKLTGVLRLLQVAVRFAIAPFRLFSAVLGRVIGLIGKLFGVLGRVGSLAARAAGNLLKPFQNIGGKFLSVGKSIITGIVNGIRAAPGAILDAIASLLPGGKLGEKVKGFLGIGSHATGGVVRTPLQLVGERGPELAALPMGTRITPLSAPAIPAASFAGTGAGGAQTTAHFYLDRRLVATAVATDTADQQARRGTALR